MKAYKRAVKGQRKPKGYPAEVYNRTLDLIEEADRLTKGDATPIGRYRYGNNVVLVSNEELIPLENASVVGFDGPMFGMKGDDSDSETLLTDGIQLKAAPPLPGEPFGILQDTIEPQCVGEVVVSGPAFCLIDVTDADHEYADVIEHETGFLESAATGPVRILGKAPGTGFRWASVLLSPSTAGGGIGGGTYIIKVQIGPYTSSDRQLIPVVAAEVVAPKGWIPPDENAPDPEPPDEETPEPEEGEEPVDPGPPLPETVSNPAGAMPLVGTIAYAAYNQTLDVWEIIECIDTSTSAIILRAIADDQSGTTSTSIAVKSVEVITPPIFLPMLEDVTFFDNEEWKLQVSEGDTVWAVYDYVKDEFIAFLPQAGGGSPDTRVWTCEVKIKSSTPTRTGTGIEDSTEIYISGDDAVVVYPPYGIFETEYDEEEKPIPGRVYAPTTKVSNPMGFPFLVTDTANTPTIRVRYVADDPNKWVIEPVYLETYFEGRITTEYSEQKKEYGIKLFVDENETLADSEISAKTSFLNDGETLQGPSTITENDGDIVGVTWTKTRGYKITQAIR